MGSEVCSSGELGVEEASEGDSSRRRGPGGGARQGARAREVRGRGGARGSPRGAGPAAASAGHRLALSAAPGPARRRVSLRPTVRGSHRPRIPATSDPPRPPSPRCRARPRPVCRRPLVPGLAGSGCCAPPSLCTRRPFGTGTARSDEQMRLTSFSPL